MNGHFWRGVGTLLAVALIGALWTGSNQLSSMETSISYIRDQIDGIATDTKENRNRISALERQRSGGRF